MGTGASLPGIHVQGVSVHIGSQLTKLEPFAQAFLWVPNLAGHDPLYIMPALAMIFQFVSQRMAIPYGYSKTADPQQQQMNRMMTWMPLLFMVFYLNFASGAVLYWAASSLFGAVQQYFITGFGALAEFPGVRDDHQGGALGVGEAYRSAIEWADEAGRTLA